MLFCAIESKFWGNFCRAVGRDDLLSSNDESAPVDFGSGVGGDSLAHVLQEIFHTRTQAQWTALALEADIALGPANQVADLRDDPHLKSRGIIHESVHPHAGPFTSVGWAAPVKGQPFAIEHPAPLLGEHTDEVLAELGLDKEQIARLHSAGIV